MKVVNIDTLIPSKYKNKYINDNPLTVIHPANCLLAGKTRGGKTNLAFNLLLVKEIKMNFNRVYIICRDKTEDKYKFILDHFQKLEKKILDQTGHGIKLLTITDNLDELPDLDKDIDIKKQNVIIWDDLVLTKNQKRIEEYYIRSLKKSCTNLYLTQSYYKVPKTIRLNTQYFFLFEVPSRRELTSLYMDFGGEVESQRVFNKMVRESTKGHDFFLLDTKGPDEMKYRKNFDYFWKVPKKDNDDETKGLKAVHAFTKFNEYDDSSSSESD